MDLKKGIEVKDLAKFLQKISRLPRFLASHAFLTFIFLFLFALGIGGLVFYKYKLITTRTPESSEEGGFRFEEEAYQRILREWEEREKKISEIGGRNYADPFSPKTP